MNPAIPFPGAVPAQKMQTLGQPRLIPSALVQAAVIAIPTSATLGLAMFQISGWYLIGMLTLFTAYHLVQREPLRAATLIVACMPFLAVYRGIFFPYSAATALMAGAAAVALLEPEHLQRIRRNYLLLALAAAVIVYWWISIVISGDYAANLKAVELLMGAVSVYLISWRRSLLGSALAGMGIMTVAMGLGMLPHGTRLGMTDDLEGGGRFGNPILLGIPAAFVLILTLIDRGRWLLLENRPVLRNLLGIAVAAMLVLSTSRGAWAIALAGLVLVFVFDPSSRRNIGLACLMGLAAIAAIMSTSRADIITKQFDKLLDSDRDWTQRTTGRSEQWIGFPDAFMAAPVFGHGPSRGREVSLEYAHKNIPFHSLYLHVGAETGLVGMVLLLLFLVKLCSNTLRHRTETLEVGPLFAVVGFMVIGLSVSALDMQSGAYVGLALSAGYGSGIWRMRSAKVMVAAD